MGPNLQEMLHICSLRNYKSLIMLQKLWHWYGTFLELSCGKCCSPHPFHLLSDYPACVLSNTIYRPSWGWESLLDERWKTVSSLKRGCCDAGLSAYQTACVFSPTVPVCMSKCPWARYWTTNRSRRLTSAQWLWMFCMSSWLADRHCVKKPPAISVWMFCELLKMLTYVVIKLFGCLKTRKVLHKNFVLYQNPSMLCNCMSLARSASWCLPKFAWELK